MTLNDYKHKLQAEITLKNNEVANYQEELETKRTIFTFIKHILPYLAILIPLTLAVSLLTSYVLKNNLSEAPGLATVFILLVIIGGAIPEYLSRPDDLRHEINSCEDEIKHNNYIISIINRLENNQELTPYLLTSENIFNKPDDKKNALKTNKKILSELYYSSDDLTIDNFGNYKLNVITPFCFS